jgi:putative flippase GtrA
VNLVSTVYRRFRLLIHEGSKFLVIGGIGFVVAIGGADILHFDVGLGKYTSVTVATIVATVVTFLGNRHWTFRHRAGKGTAHESVVFFVLNGVGLLMQYACIGLVQDALGLQGKLWFNAANLLGTAFGTLFRFWSYRKWVWHAQAAGPEAAGLAAAPVGRAPGRPESLEPVLVPRDDRTFRPAPGAPGQRNGYQAQPNGHRDQSGQGRPDGPRHARSR